MVQRKTYPYTPAKHHYMLTVFPSKHYAENWLNDDSEISKENRDSCKIIPVKIVPCPHSEVGNKATNKEI